MYVPSPIFFVFQLRTDVEGSLEAILEVISTYSSTRCNLQLVDFGVGPPTEKEIEMAETAGGTRNSGDGQIDIFNYFFS